MRCHYCDREAAYEATSNGVRVGLCEHHLRSQVEELSASPLGDRLREKIDDS